MPNLVIFDPAPVPPVPLQPFLKRVAAMLMFMAVLLHQVMMLAMLVAFMPDVGKGFADDWALMAVLVGFVGSLLILDYANEVRMRYVWGDNRPPAGMIGKAVRRLVK